jgi:uncharacterized protein (DUF885 family)
VTTFVERMTRAKGVDTAEQSQLARAAAEAVKNRVYPAYARMTAALESQRPAAIGQAAGVGRLPDGAAYYAAALRQMTTTDYTPEQVHALGLAEVARVSAQMDALLVSQGLATGTVAARVQRLHKDPRFLLPNTDAGRQQLLLSTSRSSTRSVRACRSTSVPSRPASCWSSACRGRPKAAPPAPTTRQAAMDGSRPGTFFANLRDVGETATWTMKTLAYHEGIPGHHFQISTALVSRICR